MLFLAATTALVRVTTGEGVLGASSCETDADCQATTNRCYFGRGTGGSCQCNPVTNAGCAENEICSDRPTWADGFPACVDPSTLGPMGEKCDFDEDCATKRCFRGFQPPDTPGSCQCNSQTNAGCSESEICSDAPLAYDGSPECVVGVGEERRLQSLPIGSDCSDDAQCASDSCFTSPELPPGFPGICDCNIFTNAGCEGNTPLCWDNPNIEDEPAECTSVSLPLGSECFIDDQCDSDSCFISAELPFGFPGICDCNIFTNAGCGGDTPLCWDNPVIADEPAQCTAGSLALGSECFIDNQCASNSCFISRELQFGVPGKCACNLLTTAGCGGDTPLCWDNPIVEDEPPVCIDPATLRGIGGQCENDNDCASLRCFQGESATKICTCNSNTNAGCAKGEVCSDEPTSNDGLPECRNKDVTLSDIFSTLYSLVMMVLNWLLSLVPFF